MIISVHTHNDVGCAVSSAELAVLAGADRVEGTLLGNGERTGNMDIVIMAMNLYSQGVNPELDLSNPDEIITVATECSGISVDRKSTRLTASHGYSSYAVTCLQKKQ